MANPKVAQLETALLSRCDSNLPRAEAGWGIDEIVKQDAYIYFYRALRADPEFDRALEEAINEKKRFQAAERAKQAQVALEKAEREKWMFRDPRTNP